MMKSEDVRKMKYVLEVFEGACEIDNFEEIRLPFKKEKNITDILKSALNTMDNNCNKAYFNTCIFDPDESIEFGIICREAFSIYRLGEIINIACMVLDVLDIYDITVGIKSSKDFDPEELIENLGMINLTVNDEGKNKTDEFLTFSITYKDREIARGGVDSKKEYSYLFMKYDSFSEIFKYRDEDDRLDLYINPTDEEVLSDAFTLGTELRDSGFSVEVDYSLKQAKSSEVKASVIITFDKDDIAKNQVKLVDMATREIKTVKIRNLLEELAFI